MRKNGPQAQSKTDEKQRVATASSVGDAYDRLLGSITNGLVAFYQGIVVKSFCRFFVGLGEIVFMSLGMEEWRQSCTAVIDRIDKSDVDDIAEDFGDAAVHVTKETIDNVTEVGEAAVVVAKNTIDNVTEVAEDLGEAAVVVAQNTIDNVTEAAEDLGEVANKMAKVTGAAVKAAADEWSKEDDSSKDQLDNTTPIAVSDSDKMKGPILNAYKQQSKKTVHALPNKLSSSSLVQPAKASL